jgi:TolB-like protein
MLHLRALGTPSVDVSGSPARGAGGQRKPLALLSLLAVAGERGLSRDRLLAYLWPESAADRAGHRLTQLLYSIRRDLRADELFLGTADLCLNPTLLGSDIAAFSAALGRGDYAAAVAVYGGPFLDGFFLDDAPEFERWVDGERARLARRQAEALEALALAAERSGDTPAAAEWWRRRVDSEPLNGRVVARCMDALVSLGERAEAIRLARAHEARMQEELQAPADPEVVAALRRLRVERAAALAGDGSAPGAPATSVAVLPFLNLSPGRESEYFSDGVTEELIHALAQVPGLKVAARSSSFAFKGKPIDAREIGERLGVGSLVEGSVRMVGRRIRLAVQLISAADGYQRWSDTYERTIDDVFALQEELARAVVTALPLSPHAASLPAAPRGTRDPEAYTLYLRGRYAALKRTIQGFSLGIEYFEQATERDPSYALAHAGLAECWTLLGFAEYGDLAPAIAMPKARAAALQSQRLDPTLPEPHLWLGAVRLLFDWDLPGAEAAIRRALELSPDLAYAQAWYAVYLSVQRRFDDAMHYARRAQALEPMSLTLQLVTARVLYWSRRLDEALEMLKAMRMAEPGHPAVAAWLARSLALAGDPEEGVAVLADLPERARACHIMGIEALFRATLGQRERANALCEALEIRVDQGGPYGAAARLALGQCDRAVALLERLLSERSGIMVFSGVDDLLGGLRAEPRTAAVLERLGVPMG